MDLSRTSSISLTGPDRSKPSTSPSMGHAPERSDKSQLDKQISDPKASSPQASGAFMDSLNYYDTSMWLKSDGWSNGGVFNCGWLADHVEFQNGKMVITLDDSSSSGKPYSSGEYKANDFYGFGTVEASIKAISVPGAVAALFIYTGPSDGNPQDEIDLEFVKGKLQTNYFTNGIGGHESTITLAFDPSQSFHTYKIEWRSNMIIWYADGINVHSENGSRGPLPKTPGRIMANFWPVTGADGWSGHFTYTSPLTIEYDWIKYMPFVGISDPGAQPANTSGPLKYQNPFRSDLSIKYQLESECIVTLRIYNTAGKLIRTLEPGTKSCGAHEEVWDGKNANGNKVDSGMYLFILKAGDVTYPTFKAAKIR